MVSASKHASNASQAGSQCPSGAPVIASQPTPPLGTGAEHPTPAHPPDVIFATSNNTWTGPLARWCTHLHSLSHLQYGQLTVAVRSGDREQQALTAVLANITAPEPARHEVRLICPSQYSFSPTWSTISRRWSWWSAKWIRPTCDGGAWSRTLTCGVRS